MDLASDQDGFLEFLEGVPDAILAVDTSGIIQVVNQQAEVMFGYTRHELIGQLVEVLVPLRVKEAHPHHRALYSLDPKKRPMGAGLELSAVRKDGTEFPCDISLSRVQFNNRTLTLAAVRDITERVRYESQFVAGLTTQMGELAETVKTINTLVASQDDTLKSNRTTVIVASAVMTLMLTIATLAVIFTR